MKRSASEERDEYGREVESPVHRSNCWVYAIKAWGRHGGRLSIEWAGWVPHMVLTSEDGVHEFVYGKLGRNECFPLLFRGYGIVSRP